MTFDKHQIDGIGGFSQKVMAAQDFEELLTKAGYEKLGNAPAQGSWVKAW